MGLIKDYLFMRRCKKCFGKIEREVEALEKDIDIKQGFLWFKKHRYTQEELLNSKRVTYINSVMANLENHAKGLAKSNRISSNVTWEYNEQRKATEKHIKAIIRKIEERDPTKFDRYTSKIKSFLESLINRFPVVGRSASGGEDQHKLLE